MPGMGPPPKHPSQKRRKSSLQMTSLPSEGRKGDPPAFPLAKPTPAEKKLWAELWATPQAVAWERLGWTRIVGRYCRLVNTAERVQVPNMPLLVEVRQLEDRLGLSPMAMLRLRWEISGDDLAEVRADKAAAPARPRVLAVDPKLTVVGGRKAAPGA